MTVLWSEFLHIDWTHPDALHNDRVIFSKGHAAPLLYTLFAMSGAIAFDELFTLRQKGSRLEGHPTPAFPFSPVATGSLGQGLSVGLGMALGLKKLFGTLPAPKVYVLLGDGEMAEGQVWEAAALASFHRVDNLVAIVDVNGLGQSQHTMSGYNAADYAHRFGAFGWDTQTIDGHDHARISEAYRSIFSGRKGVPHVIVAHTKKGKGVSFLEDKEGWHGKALSAEDASRALAELNPPDPQVVFDLSRNDTHGVKSIADPFVSRSQHKEVITYDVGTLHATREAYGDVIAALAGSDPRILVLDGDTKNSTFAQTVAQRYPNQYIECFIAEQNMVSMAAGLSTLGYRVYVSTFAAFLTRAYDQLRMAHLSGCQIRCVGSHAGVAIGEDGASQMGIEEIALFSTFRNCAVIQPSDSMAMSILLPQTVDYDGMVYIQTMRPKTEVLTRDTDMNIGSMTMVGEEYEHPAITILATGITVHEALKAQSILARDEVYVHVIDCYSLVPFDTHRLVQAAIQSRGRLLTVEDHVIQGGLGSLVSTAFSDREGIRTWHLGIEKTPFSATSAQLLAAMGIDAQSIASYVRHLIGMLQ
jgi:transketolase